MSERVRKPPGAAGGSPPPVVLATALFQRIGDFGEDGADHTQADDHARRRVSARPAEGKRDGGGLQDRTRARLAVRRSTARSARRRWRQIGGQTGDVAGAAQQSAEIARWCGLLMGVS